MHEREWTYKEMRAYYAHYFKAVNITFEEAYKKDEKPFNVSERRWNAAKKSVMNLYRDIQENTDTV